MEITTAFADGIMIISCSDDLNVAPNANRWSNINKIKRCGGEIQITNRKLHENGIKLGKDLYTKREVKYLGIPAWMVVRKTLKKNQTPLPIWILRSINI